MSDITGSSRRRARRAVQDVIPTWRSSAALEALDDLLRLAEQVPHDIARKAGLSTTELHSLRHLVAAPMGPVELARVLGVTSAASSGVVDRMVARGHAERRPHPDDGRRTVVVVTDSGRRELATQLAPMFAALAELDAELTDRDRAVVERYLRGAADAIRQVR